MQLVLDVASLYRWRAMHIFDSRRSAPGWPDLTLVRVPEFLVAELKTDTGRLSVSQREWLDLLAGCGIETHVWRPRDFDEVLVRLTRHAAS